MWGLIFTAIIAIYVYKNIPKPQSTPRPGFGDIKTPTADPSRDIPVIFGTVDLAGPHIAWRGDFSTKAIKVSSGKK